jgi:hypothetical protein
MARKSASPKLLGHIWLRLGVWDASDSEPALAKPQACCRARSGWAGVLSLDVSGARRASGRLDFRARARPAAACCRELAFSFITIHPLSPCHHGILWH